MSADPLVSVRARLLRVGAGFLFAFPDRILTRIFGEPPAAAAGLRPDAWALCRVAGLIEDRDAHEEATAMRTRTEMLARVVAARTSFPVEAVDLDLGTPPEPLPARLYCPQTVTAAGPMLVYFHGGGWVAGSLDSHDSSCRRLAANSGARLLAVEYRLAPEHPFPAAPDDALRAWNAVTAAPSRFGADPARIAVGGDSAGANLAAVLCQELLRADRPQPAFQLLVYPVTEIGSNRESRRIFAQGFYLTRERIEWYERLYLGGGRADDPRASPLRAASFEGLAPANVITSLADPVRDEGEAYARELMAAGVDVRLDRFPLLHAWFNQTVSRSSRLAHDVLATRVRERFGP